MSRNEFVVPEVHIGDTVVWFHSPGMTDEHSALVSGVGNDMMLDLHIFAPGVMNPMFRNGVRHRFDPNTEAINNANVGVWDLSYGEREYRNFRDGIEKAVGRLEERVDGVASKVVDLSGALA